MAMYEYKVGTSTCLDNRYVHSHSTLKFLALDNKQALAKTLQNNIEAKDSDLISGVYEGGLKVWECSFDLVDYIAAHP